MFSSVQIRGATVAEALHSSDSQLSQKQRRPSSQRKGHPGVEGKSRPISLNSAPTEGQKGNRRGQRGAGKPILSLLFFLSGGIPEQAKVRAAEGKNDRAHLRAAGYIVEEGTGRGVRVAPWVIKEQKKSLYSSLVGFLKSKSDGLKQVESWLESCWGKMPHNMQMLDDQVVWMQVSSPGEVEEILLLAATGDFPSPFSVLQRWMEVLGSPPNP